MTNQDPDFIKSLLGDPALERGLFQSFAQEQRGGATGPRQRFFSQDTVFNNIRNEFQGLLAKHLRQGKLSTLNFNDFLGGREDDPLTTENEFQQGFDFESRFRNDPQNFLQRQSSRRLLAPPTSFRF